MAKFLDENGLLYLWQKLTTLFVKKEAGKGLSTNDYTTAEKEKLANTYTKTEIDGKGFLTEHQDISGKADKANTLSGYGITDAYTKAEIDGKGFLTEHQDISGKADKATTLSGYGITDAYTKTETNQEITTRISGKADKATTLSGYGITNAYTKDEVDSKLSSVYKPGGSFDFASLPTPSASNLGYVYSVNDAFTTDDRFLASEPVEYPIGTNVVVIAVSADSTTKYLFDVLAGFIDLSSYMQHTDMVAITNQEIDTIAV